MHTAISSDKIQIVILTFKILQEFVQSLTLQTRKKLTFKIFQEIFNVILEPCCFFRITYRIFFSFVAES